MAAPAGGAAHLRRHKQREATVVRQAGCRSTTHAGYSALEAGTRETQTFNNRTQPINQPISQPSNQAADLQQASCTALGVEVSHQLLGLALPHGNVIPI